MRYFLDQDNSSHWYMIPAENRKEWDAWRIIDEDDPRSWYAPTFAMELETHANQVTFENPEHP